jgi:hypothetical protein
LTRSPSWDAGCGEAIAVGSAHPGIQTQAAIHGDDIEVTERIKKERERERGRDSTQQYARSRLIITRRLDGMVYKMRKRLPARV